MGHKLVLMVICVNLKDFVRAIHVRLLSCLCNAEIEEICGKIIKGLSLWLIHVGHIECVLVIW